MKVICYGILAIAIIGGLVYGVPLADAYQTIYITPTKASYHNATDTELFGSRIPGCQDPVVVNGTTIREAGCFTPNDINVKIGTLIIFKNDDATAHSFTSEKFNSQLMINDGTEYNWVVDYGRTTFSCLLHPWSEGTITGVIAPGLETIKNYPSWVVTLFNWYDGDIIDYDTFINALVYLMSYGIIQEIDEKDPEPEEKTTESTVNCDEVDGTTLKKKLGCIPAEAQTIATANSTDKCEGVLGTALKKRLGCT